MIETKQTKVTRQAQASLHPETGNMRLSIYTEKTGWVFYFFNGKPEAVDFLESALELVDPQHGEGAGDA